eukprot:COSAG03_NODE_2625_length_2584_cov_1.265191_2_plen_209_part_00
MPLGATRGRCCVQATKQESKKEPIQPLPRELRSIDQTNLNTRHPTPAIRHRRPRRRSTAESCRERRRTAVTPVGCRPNTMSYVPPSRRGGDFKSRADGESIPTLANAKNEAEEKAPRARAPASGSWERAPPPPEKKSTHSAHCTLSSSDLARIGILCVRSVCEFRSDAIRVEQVPCRARRPPAHSSPGVVHAATVMRASFLTTSRCAA